MSRLGNPGSLCDRLEEFLPHWYSVACTVTLLGLERGTFANMDEVVAASAGHLRSDEAREVKYKTGDQEEEKERKLRKSTPLCEALSAFWRHP